MYGIVRYFWWVYGTVYYFIYADSFNLLKTYNELIKVDMPGYEACKAAAQLASQGKGAGVEDTIALDVHSINELKVDICLLFFVKKVCLFNFFIRLFYIVSFVSLRKLLIFHKIF